MSSSLTPLDRSTIRRGLNAFTTRWRAKLDALSTGELSRTEKAHAQTFWSDLLRQFGVIPEQFSLFEHEAVRATTGNRGYIDVFRSNLFIGEAKSVGKDLAAAERQALDYLAGGSISRHEWPKFVLCTDFETFRLTKLGHDRDTIIFPLAALSDHIDQLMFLAGRETVTKQEQEEASIEASRVMADLYTAMVGEEADEVVGDQAPRVASQEDLQVQRASIFLTRLLFLLYGDDAGLWEEDLFHRFVLYDTTPGNLGGQLSALFEVLNAEDRRNVPASMGKFPYVNGALFEDRMPVEFFSAEMRDALLRACRFRWTRISPAVFGSMFQMVKSKEARRTAGEHYTTEDNILKTLGPLFLDQMQAEADRLCRNASTTPRQLRAFQDELATHTFLDPACGSGNFLTVAYGRIREIETQLIKEIRERTSNTQMALDATWETKVTIDQFHGIELSWWPAKIAETAMFLVDHQANRALAAEVGEAPNRLPITITAHIEHRNALTTDWTTLIPPSPGQTFVFGNPPFLGHETRTKEQADELRAVWRRRDIGRLDYVTGWHAQAIQFLAGREGEFAYVTTNSISQGDQVPRLFEPLQDRGWRIKFAHRTFPWTSEAPGRAAVHCVIIGFTRDQETRARLWDSPDATGESTPVQVQEGVNAYLVDGPAVLVEPRRMPLSPEILPATFGNMPRDGGGLIVEPEDYDTVTADLVAAKYVRPYRGSRELLHGAQRWCLWLEDMDPGDVNRSAVLRERLQKVADFRSRSSAASTRAMAATPHLFGQRSQPSVEYLCIPRVVSENRRYFIADRYGPDVIASDAAFKALDPDGLQFALLSSSMFIAWQRTVGGRLKSDLRFANTLTWHTFPVPALASSAREKLIGAGQGILAARNRHPGRSLADAYHPLAMDPTLVRAHDELDRLVDRAFGSTRRLSSDRQRLELLFKSYATLSGTT